MNFWTSWLSVGLAAELFALLPGTSLPTLSSYWRAQVLGLHPVLAFALSIVTFSLLVWLVPHWGFRRPGWVDDAAGFALGAAMGALAARYIRRTKD